MLHSHDAVRPALTVDFRVEAAAIVVQRESVLVAVRDEIQHDMPGSSVTDDVVQPFLDDAEQRDRNDREIGLRNGLRAALF